MSVEQYYQLMCDYVFDSGSATPLKALTQHYSDAELQARLNIYRNNTHYSLINALQELFPATLTTIGESLFMACAQHYLQKHPPTSAAMIDLGHEFPDFLTHFPLAQHLYYLPDLARLELSRNQSYHAEDQEPLGPETFNTINIETLTRSRITPVASAFLLTSKFSVFDIWQLAVRHTANTAQSQHENERIVLADQAQHLLVIRQFMEVEVYALSHGVFTFLRQLTLGEALGQALESAIIVDDSFNPSEAISFFIQCGFTHQILGDST